MTTAILDLPQTSDPRVRGELQLADQAKAFVVTRANKVDAEQTLLLLNDAEKKIRGVLDPICDAANQAHKAATGKRAELLKPIDEARQHLKRGCAVIQAQLDEEARIEAQRLVEAQAAAERARLEAEADEVLEYGDLDAALAIAEEAAAVEAAPASAMRVAPPTATGITYRDNWKFGYVDAKGKATDKPDLSLIPIEYHAVNDTAIGAVVRGLKDRTNIPGIRVYNDRQPVGVGGRR